MGGASASPWKAGKKKRQHEQEWDEIGRKVEQKVMREVKSWADEPDDAPDEPDQKSENEKEWEEIGRKVEAKIKRKIRKWAEED